MWNIFKKGICKLSVCWSIALIVCHVLFFSVTAPWSEIEAKQIASWERKWRCAILVMKQIVGYMKVYIDDKKISVWLKCFVLSFDTNDSSPCLLEIFPGSWVCASSGNNSFFFGFFFKFLTLVCFELSDNCLFLYFTDLRMQLNR